MIKRVLGRSGIEVSALGMGCWAIGGPYWRTDGTNRSPMGWGQIDDNESIRAVHRSIELGVNFFDTANNYGAGHSERILGQALAGKREKVIVATKFGSIFDEETKSHFDNRLMEATPAFVREACEASLKRLNTDYIDVYQLHWGQCPPEEAEKLLPILEDLVKEGKIRWYGWSTDDAARARVFAQGEHCTSIQHRVNLFNHANDMLKVCDEFNLASINKGPLGSGVLTGKFSKETKITDEHDGRSDVNFGEGRMALVLDKLDELRALLTRDGRTLAQAALGWIWAHHPRTIPIPGFKNVAQVEDNAGAANYGALSAAQMQEIDTLLGEVANRA